MGSATTTCAATRSGTAREWWWHRQRRSARLSSGMAAFLENDGFAEHEGIHAAPLKGAHGLGGRVDDGFTSKIETRVQEHRYSGGLTERGDQSVISRTRVGRHDLHTGRAVDMRRCRDHVPGILAHRRDEQHEAGGQVFSCIWQVDVALDASDWD